MFSCSVDVVVADLRTVEVDEDMLSVSELGKALWIDSPALLTDYLAAHTWLRRRLSEYLDHAPAEIQFEDDEHGKPVVVSPVTDLSFNVAYSGGMAALVVGFRKDVGIDIEMIDVAQVDGLWSEDRDRATLRQRVRRESMAKATGVRSASPEAIGGHDLTDIDLGRDFVAAVAAPSGTRVDVVIVATESAPVRPPSYAPILERSPLRLAGVGQ